MSESEDSTAPPDAIRTTNLYHTRGLPQKLLRSAGNIRAPIDGMGYSDDALVHDRGQPKEQTLSWEITLLQKVLGAGLSPAAVDFLLVSGSLTATNKDTREETRERLEANLERRLRPVNSGSGILKTPLRVAL